MAVMTITGQVITATGGCRDKPAKGKSTGYPVGVVDQVVFRPPGGFTCLRSVLPGLCGGITRLRSVLDGLRSVFGGVVGILNGQGNGPRSGLYSLPVAFPLSGGALALIIVFCFH